MNKLVVHAEMGLQITYFLFLHEPCLCLIRDVADSVDL